MLITSEHKKIVKYSWLYGYLFTGLFAAISFIAFIKLKNLGIVLFFFLACWFSYVLYLTFKEANSNPKKIEILYMERNTPKLIYIFWAIFFVLVLSLLGALTFLMLIDIIFEI